MQVKSEEDMIYTTLPLFLRGGCSHGLPCSKEKFSKKKSDSIIARYKENKLRDNTRCWRSRNKIDY